MKAIQAYVRRHLAPHVINRLREAGCHTLSVLDISGITPDISPDALDPSAALEHAVEAISKLEIIAPDESVPLWTDVIVRTAFTGRPGDGLVVVLAVESATRIRRGSAGAA